MTKSKYDMKSGIFTCGGCGTEFRKHWIRTIYKHGRELIICPKCPMEIKDSTHTKEDETTQIERFKKKMEFLNSLQRPSKKDECKLYHDRECRRSEKCVKEDESMPKDPKEEQGGWARESGIADSKPVWKTLEDTIQELAGDKPVNWTVIMACVQKLTLDAFDNGRYESEAFTQNAIQNARKEEREEVTEEIDKINKKWSLDCMTIEILLRELNQ